MSKVITKIVSKNSSKEKKAVSKGKIITAMSLLLRRSGSVKHSVFPLPVPMSRAT